MRRVLLLAVLAHLSAPLASAAGEDLPERGPAQAFAGLGAWVSVFDAAAWDRPERAVADMHSHGVRTLYLQSASSSPGPAVFRPDRTDRFLRAAHVRGMAVVAWYLPPYTSPRYELRRALGAVRFRSSRGDRFDAFALDIETAPGSPAVALRNRRLRTLSERLRRAVGTRYALGAIIPSPYGLEQPQGRRWWPRFPYRALHRTYDAFLPMGYYTYHGDGPRNAARDTRLNLSILRRETGDPDVPIHVIGGMSDASGLGEGRAFAHAINRHGAIGASLYSHVGMDGRDWLALRTLRFSGSP